MRNKKEQKYMLADRVSEGEYWPSEIESSWEKLYEGLEYGDVYEGEYQIWEYPSGKILKIETDRKVDDKDYYSVPYTTKGTIWLPKLTLLKTDKEKVEEAYKSFLKPPTKKSLFQWIKKIFGA